MEPINPTPCKEPQTNSEKEWPYDEYYIGERDKEGRKTGHGQYCWSGAESLESYTGRLLRDTKHGVGEYISRHRVVGTSDITWEGHYYNSFKHGYGLMSYRNGKLFCGIYHSDLRWGPGVETHISLCENVGLWRGDNLIRLTWKPPVCSVVPDLMSTSVGISIVAKHRAVLVVRDRIIGETNPALELLKQYGAPSLEAAQKWPKLYPKNCTDIRSQFFYRDVFDHAYYGNTIHTLEPIDMVPSDIIKNQSQDSINSSISPPDEFIYAWNNNLNIMHVMRHCYQHDYQISDTRINLENILNGPRSLFKPAAQDELDCRMFLMACYLGHIKNVSQLINEYDVCPNVTDIQGNSAIMYAACGHQAEIIHFLVEAGSRINDYNDNCCTALGVALINFTCFSCNIPPSKIVQAILPPSVPLDQNDMISEWKIVRESKASSNPTAPAKVTDTKPNKNTHVKSTAIETVTSSKISDQVAEDSKKSIKMPNQEIMQVLEPNETFSEDKCLYFNLLNEYTSMVNDKFGVDNTKLPITYIFEVMDMVLETDLSMAEEKKEVKRDINKKISKMFPPVVLQTEADKNQIAELEINMEREFDAQMTTIKQLLSDGADPRHVRCPQSAMFLALMSQCSELIELLAKYGADPNEVYTESLGYYPLDVAVSKPFSVKSLNVIRKLLECGARTDRRIPIINNNIDTSIPSVPELGPTLLHVVLTRKEGVENNETLRRQILELLLAFGCDPIAQYKGCSAMDMAMSRDIEIFNIFIESPGTNLNAVINEDNQNILAKMFYRSYCKNIPITDRVQMLTSLLLYGADPLLKCQNGDKSYDNLFVYAKQEIEASVKPPGTVIAKETKKQPDPKKKSESTSKTNTRTNTKTNTDEIDDYKQCLSLVRDCARILFIRSLQAKLLKELIQVVDKYKHRNWVMILKEYKSGKRCGLWLTPVRCLEIWDELKSTKKKMYNDKILLKFVLCIVTYHFKKTKHILRGMTSAIKASIETEAAYFIREHSSPSQTAIKPFLKRPYVKPELICDSEYEKFKICFECAMPIYDEHKLPCGLCKLVDFCTFGCMRENINRPNCHPCSYYLKNKYFPPIPEEAGAEAESHDV